MNEAVLQQIGFYGSITIAFLVILAFDVFLWRRKVPLWVRILIAMVVGGAIGLVSQPLTDTLKPLGDLFINAIRMMIVPLIFTTLVAGVTQMGDVGRLGSIGGKTIGVYLVTTWFAVTTGIVLALLLQPGVGVPIDAAQSENIARIEGNLQKAEDAGGLVQQLLGIVPTNPVQAMVEGDVLAIIFFAILTGAGLLLAGEAGKPAVAFFQSASEGVLKMTGIVMELAPIGIVGLMAHTLATNGFSVFDELARLALGMYAGAFFHMFVIYGLIMIVVIARYPIVRFFRGILSAQAVAFSTSSSNATLPATIKATTENLGVSKRMASAVLPLGATINMDGTAIYLGLIAIMGAQALGMPLDMTDYAMIMLTATLASIGTAGIPSASLFLASLVMGSIGIPAEKAVMLVAFILPFDRLLDMMRTVVNITGDAATAVVVAKWERELDVPEADAATEPNARPQPAE